MRHFLFFMMTLSIFIGSIRAEMGDKKEEVHEQTFEIIKFFVENPKNDYWDTIAMQGIRGINGIVTETTSEYIFFNIKLPCITYKKQKCLDLTHIINYLGMHKKQDKKKKAPEFIYNKSSSRVMIYMRENFLFSLISISMSTAAISAGLVGYAWWRSLQNT